MQVWAARAAAPQRGYVRTYLEWAERNLRLNGLSGRASPDSGRLRAGARANEQFDLIFIDRRRYNSKRMEESFDVQRDHVALMKDLKRLPA